MRKALDGPDSAKWAEAYLKEISAMLVSEMAEVGELRAEAHEIGGM